MGKLAAVVVGGAAVLGAMTVHSGPASADAGVSGGGAYTVSRLPVLAGTTRSEASAVSPDGDWVGGSIDTGDGVHHLALWHHGRLVASPAVPVNDAVINAVGRGGLAVGEGFRAEDGQRRGFTLSRGAYAELPLPAGAESSAAAGVDSLGDVAGQVSEAGSTRVVVWPATRRGAIRTLPLPAGITQAGVVGMAPDGTVAAQASDADFTMRGLVWNAAGVRTELAPAVAGAQVLVQAVADGFAIGSQFDLATNTAATVRWDLRHHSATVVTSLDSAEAVTARGEYGGQQAGAAAVVVRGVLTSLPGLSATGASEVEALAGDALAAGFSRDENGVVSAVTWTREH
jgi:uncharacterized membrane protein